MAEALPRRARPYLAALINSKIKSRIMNSSWFNGAEKFAHRVL
jgi:hypothetical protein